MGGMTEVDREGRSPLHYAALDGDLEVVRGAATAGADVNLQDRNGHTPLHLAAQQGQVEAAAALLASGARVDLEDRHGNQPLWTAVFNSRGDGRLIQMLLAHGADPSHRNRAGKSPVELARLIANYPVAQFFNEIDSG
jgi:ankyrin repeat protein